MPSTVIKRLAYDPEQRELFVTFTSGDVYAYEAVPPEAYEAFRTAFSKGQHFAKHVRQKYLCRRVARDPDFWRPGVGR